MNAEHQRPFTCYVDLLGYPRLTISLCLNGKFLYFVVVFCLTNLHKYVILQGHLRSGILFWFVRVFLF
jgi:hypothetical protein